MRYGFFFSKILVLASVLALQPTFSIAADADMGKESAAESAFLQLSVFSPAQLVDEKKSISGLRLNLVYANNADVSGIDLGFGVNSVSGNVTGIQIAGVLNSAEDAQHGTVKGIQIAGLGNNAGSLSGIQIGGFGNSVRGDATGIQIGLFMNFVYGEMKGIQVGAFNNAFSVGAMQRYAASRELSVTGIQIGAFNLAKSLSGVQIGGLNGSDDVHGVQVGLLNGATKVRGIQIGIYNECKTLEGVQLGLINNVEESSIPYLPILRASF